MIMLKNHIIERFNIEEVQEESLKESNFQN